MPDFNFMAFREYQLNRYFEVVFLTFPEQISNFSQKAAGQEVVIG